MASPIRLDRSTVGVVVHCRTCGHWAEYTTTEASAWRVAEAHETAVHPKLHHHRNARLQREHDARRSAAIAAR